MTVEARLWMALREVEDPEIPISVVGMGLIVGLSFEDGVVDLKLTFEVRFPEGEAGDQAREVMPRALAQTRDRLCTVGRTVHVGAPVEYVEA